MVAIWPRLRPGVEPSARATVQLAAVLASLFVALAVQLGRTQVVRSRAISERVGVDPETGDTELVNYVAVVRFATPPGRTLRPEMTAAVRIDQSPRLPQMPSDEIVRRLRILFAREGLLTCRLIDRAPGLPLSSLIRKRFGNMRTAYEQAGFHLAPVQSHVELRRSLAAKFTGIVTRIVADVQATGLSVVHWKWRRTFLVGDDRIFAIRIVRCTPDKRWKCPQWILSNGKTLGSDYIVAVRTDKVDHDPIDYYLLPTVELPPKRIWLGGRSWKRLERHRFDSHAALVDAIKERAEDFAECPVAGNAHI